MLIRSRVTTHGNIDLDVFVDNNRIKRVAVASSESLGLTIDEKLSCNKHIDNISKMISAGIGTLKRMRKCNHY